MNITKPEMDVGLVTANIERAIKFYRDFLGLRMGRSLPLGNGVTQHRFFIGKNLVKINEIEQVPPIHTAGLEKAVGVRELTLILDDLNVVRERLDVNNIGLLEERGFTLETDQQSLTVKDFDQNTLKLTAASERAFDNPFSRIEIGLVVKNVHASLQFYQKILGFSLDKEMAAEACKAHEPVNDEVKCVVKGGETLITLWQAEEGIPLETGDIYERTGLRYFTYAVRDLDGVYEYLKQQKVTIMKPPFEVDGVVKILLVGDPDGNCLEFLEYY